MGGEGESVSAELPGGREADRLTDRERETLTGLVREGVPANTRKALATSLRYLAAWSELAGEGSLAWPAPPALIHRFLAHHLGPEGVPEEIHDGLVRLGLARVRRPSRATIEQRLAMWAMAHRLRSLPNPFDDPKLALTVRLAKKGALERGVLSGRATPHSQTAITRDVLRRLLVPCQGRGLPELRDRALLLLAWGSGGRRRSEIGRLRGRDIERVPDDWAKAQGIPAPLLRLHLGRTKTRSAASRTAVDLAGRPAQAVLDWMATLGGLEPDEFLFCRLDRGRPEQPPPGATTGLSGSSIDRILKRRAGQAGLDPATVSAHGLRSGFMTQAALDNVPLTAAMAQATMSSVGTAARYYRRTGAGIGRVAALYEEPAMPSSAMPSSNDPSSNDEGPPAEPS